MITISNYFSSYFKETTNLAFSLLNTNAKASASKKAAEEGGEEQFIAKMRQFYHCPYASFRTQKLVFLIFSLSSFNFSSNDFRILSQMVDKVRLEVSENAKKWEATPNTLCEVTKVTSEVLKRNKPSLVCVKASHELPVSMRIASLLQKDTVEFQARVKDKVLELLCEEGYISNDYADLLSALKLVLETETLSVSLSLSLASFLEGIEEQILAGQPMDPATYKEFYRLLQDIVNLESTSTVVFESQDPASLSSHSSSDAYFK